MLLVGFSGILTGMEFPLASTLYLSPSRNGQHAEIGKTAGMLDSADHIGACCGSLLAGIFLVPLLGVTISCYFVSALNMSSVIFLLFYATHKEKREFKI